MSKTLWALILSSRPGQWVKNALIFAAIMFNDQLLNPRLFLISLYGFVVFCLLSSSIYLINDLLDAPHDRLHPTKKNRPIAKGTLSFAVAFQTAVFLSFIGLITSFLLDYRLFLLAMFFLLTNLLYSLGLKKIAVLDVLSIAASFILRALAGEVLTGYHLPIWLMLTVIFVSLFVATCKRRSELVAQGTKARPALLIYRLQLLDFYNSTFATASLLSYSLFAFFSEPPKFRTHLTQFLLIFSPNALGRKWLMAATIPFVIIGIMRYAQLIYEEQAGERPERLLVKDLPLFLAVAGWGLAVIVILYAA